MMKIGVLDLSLYNRTIKSNYVTRIEKNRVVKRKENVHLAFVSDKERMLRYASEEMSFFRILTTFPSSNVSR